MLSRHCASSTGLRPNSSDESGARTPAPLVGAGRGGGSRGPKSRKVLRAAAISLEGRPR